MKMRIGYLVPEFPGQTHTFFWREINALESMGIDVDIISTKLPSTDIMCHEWTDEAYRRTTYLFPPSTKILTTLLKLFYCEPQKMFSCVKAISNIEKTSFADKFRLFSLALVGVQLSGMAQNRGWQHLHVHSCGDAANIAMFSFLLSNLTYSLTLHGPLSDYGFNQKQKWYFAKFAIVITEKIYQEVNNKLATHLPSMVKIAPMGVDTEKFNRNTDFSSWNKIGSATIFSCGRLHPCKGHADLINSINILKQNGIDCNLFIAGDEKKVENGHRKYLENLIQSLNLQNSVYLLGSISETKVKEYLEKAHVFVLASLHEPLGVAIMEAMSMEVPVVVTRAGGVKELIDDEINGLLVEPNNPQKIAEAVTKLLLDRKLSITIGQAGRKKVTQHFHSRLSAEIIIDSIKNS